MTIRHITHAALAALALGAPLFVAACDDNPSVGRLGALELTSSAPTIEQAFVTADGWSIKYDRFHVHVTEMTVAGLDEVVTASAGAQIFDQTAPVPKLLLGATVRRARPWESVSFQIGPAAADSEITAIEPAGDPDVARMTKDGLSLYVEGKATRGAVVVAFQWGFTTDTLYSECTGELGGAPTPGLVVPVDGLDSADIMMRGDVLFRNDLLDAAPLRFDPIAGADADKDGVVTLEELDAVMLEGLRTGGAGAYGTGDNADIETLKAFVEERTRNIVGSFRAKGGCKAEPAEPAP